MNINKSLHHALTYRPVSISTPNALTLTVLAASGISTVKSTPKITGQLISAQNWTPFNGTVDKSKIGE